MERFLSPYQSNTRYLRRNLEKNLKHDCTPANGVGQIQDAKQTIKELTELIHATNGLDLNNARTVAYYAIATYEIKSLQKFPILVFSGAAGTGKTTLLDVLRNIAFEPPKSLINGNVTKAVLRDSLGKQTTALIDEADNVHEDLLLGRYSKQSSTIEINKAGREGGYSKRSVDVFGATALHRRKPFKDSALLSRSIVVRTKKANVEVYSAEKFAEFASSLEDIAKHVDWTRVPELGRDRVSDSWAPLLAVHEYVGGDWGDFAEEEMKAAEGNLSFGHESEPVQSAYNSFLSLALAEEDDVAERILMGAIAKNLPEEESLSSYQVGIILTDLGFVKSKRGGHFYFYTGGRDKLFAAGRTLGIEDEMFEEENAAMKT